MDVSTTEVISRIAHKVIKKVVKKVLKKVLKREKRRLRKANQRKFMTITIGDQAENHIGMQILGEKSQEGIDLEKLALFREKFEAMGATCEWHCLNDGLAGTEYENKAEEAVVLIIRSGVDALLGRKGANKLEKELDRDEWLDKTFWSVKHGRVCNKIARWNNCFARDGQEPDIEAKKGRVIAFDQVSLLKHIIEWLEIECEDKLVAEGNYYYDHKCGIGAHGDAERFKVFAVRLGRCAPLGYRWRIKSKGVGQVMHFQFNHGDMYIMSEKAVGTDWRKRSKLTLVHAAGAEKYMKQLEK